MSLPNDTLFNLQWYLKNTGQASGTVGMDINVETVWNDYTGKGIKVGIYDDGVQIDHPDLAGNYNAALQPIINGVAHAGEPILAGDNHGTAVAGIIVASGNNDLGVTGIAYGATFGTARYLGAANATLAQQLMNAQTNFDVVNHSWGTTANYFADGDGNANFQSSAVNGRSGLGVIMVKASGNERMAGSSAEEPVGRDANDSGDNSSRFVIDVGATLNTGFVAEYSSPGACLLVCAPAGPLTAGRGQDITTDRTFTDGYNTGPGTPTGFPDYTAFNGTSAATPVTSGVAALILQANNSLGWRDVQNILAYSARKVGSDVGGSPTGSEADFWAFNAARDWNGGGLHFSNDYGFGMVDAFAAVRLAETWRVGSPAAKVSANEMSTSATWTQPMTAIPDNNGQSLTYTFNIASNLSVESASLNIALSHSAVGDLRIILTSPNGTSSDIWRNTNDGTAINTAWNFASREFYGDLSAGTWTVTVTDNGALGTGTAGNATLTLYGSTKTADDTFIYTNEFATYAGTGSRNTLVDTGGTDTLNAAAVTAALSLNLQAGGQNLIAGQTMTIDTATTIENAIGGDGNDGVTGNSASNVIWGGRGNDIVAGLAGNDSITGGAGLDTAVFVGDRNSYATAKNAGALFIADLRGNSPDGIDRLESVERLLFSDGVAGAEAFTPVNFNGDLNSDIVWTSTNGDAVNFLMNGTTVTGANAMGGANGAAWRVKAVGDLDGNGSSDLIWQDTSGLVVAYLMNGSAVASAALIGNAGSTFSVVGSGDLNADGKSDIVVADNNGQAVGWTMDGTTITGAAAIGAANGAAWRVSAIGDLNRDGRDDLIWNDTTGSTVGYLMNGLAIQSASLIVGANGSNFSVKGAGDLNGDGRDDLVWQFSNGQAGAWLMDGLAITGGGGIGAANGSQFEIRDVADLNGDGKMDLVWQDMSNGQAVGFLMNGTSIAGAGAIGGANGSQWMIV